MTGINPKLKGKIIIPFEMEVEITGPKHDENGKLVMTCEITNTIFGESEIEVIKEEE